jgi:hypothetical protein
MRSDAPMTGEALERAADRIEALEAIERAAKVRRAKGHDEACLRDSDNDCWCGDAELEAALTASATAAADTARQSPAPKGPAAK